MDRRGVIDLAELTKPHDILRDTRADRVKLMPVSVGFITQLLQLDGETLLKMEGWPEDGVVLGARLMPLRASSGENVVHLVLTVHAPSFPVVPPNTIPPTINIRWERLALPGQELSEEEADVGI